MNPESTRYDRSAVPESSWPDGTPVSNWSKAIAALRLTDSRARGEERNIVACDDTSLLAEAA